MPSTAVLTQQAQLGKNRGFEIKNKIEDYDQSNPKSIRTLTVVRCISGPDLEILPSIGGELSHEKAENMVKFDFRLKFDLEGQGQSSHKTIGL